MQCPCSFNKCYFNSPTPAARRRRSLDLKTILQQTFTDTGFVGPLFGNEREMDHLASITFHCFIEILGQNMGFHPNQTLSWMKI